MMTSTTRLRSLIRPAATSLLAIATVLLFNGCMSTNKMQEDSFPSLDGNSANIHQDFAKQQGRLNACWQTQRKALGNRPLKMDVKVGIVGEGVVKDVTIPKVSVKNVAFEQCVKNKVKTFAFKDVFVPADLETSVTFPMQLGTKIKQ